MSRTAQWQRRLQAEVRQRWPKQLTVCFSSELVERVEKARQREESRRYVELRQKGVPEQEARKQATVSMSVMLRMLLRRGLDAQEAAE